MGGLQDSSWSALTLMRVFHESWLGKRLASGLYAWGGREPLRLLQQSPCRPCVSALTFVSRLLASPSCRAS